MRLHICSCSSTNALCLEFCIKNPSLLKQLRYLNLSSTTLQNLTNEIRSLPNLFYLDFSSNSDLKILPTSIGMLVKLQTLALSRT